MSGGVWAEDGGACDTPWSDCLPDLLRLAGGVAHDFNNLLLGIRGYTELALRAVAEGRDPSDSLSGIVSATDCATALTQQLLTFSRRRLIETELLDLRHVVADMQKLLVQLTGEEVEVEFAAPAEPVRVNADRSQIEQVLANLVVNARDAMPDGGRLTVEASTALDEGGRCVAVLEVADTGSGMDGQTVARIFEPLFTTKPEGTGLGLATVHGIVERSGGSIRVSSEVGHGTTFEIHLPFANGV